jgi:hypothetical protein
MRSEEILWTCEAKKSGRAAKTKRSEEPLPAERKQEANKREAK